MVLFAHDLPANVNNKLKEYKSIKNILKEKNIQTPYLVKLMIQWKNGPRLYMNAAEAADNMKERGYAVDSPLPLIGNDWEQLLSRNTHWSKVDSSHT